MATSKTLTPTNVTISIPEMTDQPNASVFSNCVDKEADAINLLNSNLEYFSKADGAIKPLANADLNTIKRTGNYYVGDGSNIPTDTKYGYLQVISRDNDKYVKQVWNIHYDPNEYMRVCNNGTWSDWTSLNGKMAYKKNNVASSDSSNPVNWNNLPIGSVTQVAGSNNVNAPSTSFYGIVETFAPMEVIVNWSYVMQKAYSFGTSAINHVYVRASNDGGSSWMGWTTIL